MTRATRTAEYTGATTLCLYTEPGAQPRVRTMRRAISRG